MVFGAMGCCRTSTIPSISILRLISILVEKYQLEYSTYLILVVLASVVCLRAIMVAVMPVNFIGLLTEVSLHKNI